MQVQVAHSKKIPLGEKIFLHGVPAFFSGGTPGGGGGGGGAPKKKPHKFFPPPPRAERSRKSGNLKEGEGGGAKQRHGPLHQPDQELHGKGLWVRGTSLPIRGQDEMGLDRGASNTSTLIISSKQSANNLVCDRNNRC